METLELSIDLLDKIKFESTEIFEIDSVSKEELKKMTPVQYRNHLINVA